MVNESGQSDDGALDEDRRRVLKALGALGATGLAGCGGDGDTETPTDTETEPDETPTDTDDTAGDDVVFEISSLSVEPESPISAGESITVTAEITNTGENTGSQTVEYRLDGDVAAEQNLELEGFGSDTLSFEEIDTSNLEPGQSYEHGVYTNDDGQTTTLEIQALPDLTDPLLSLNEGVLSSGEVQLTGTISNAYLFSVVDGEVTLTVPDDWEIVNQSGTTFDELEGASSQNVSWTLSIPDDASGDYELTAMVSYSDGIQEPAEFTVEHTVNVFNEQEGQVSWSAADYDVEENPEDTWEPQNAVTSWLIQEDDDGQYLALAGVNSERSTIRFTGADQTRAVEVRATLKSTTDADDNWIYVRSRNEDEPQSGITQARINDYLSGDPSQFRLGVYDNGELTTGLTTMDRIGGAGDLYHLRARYEGETWQTKVWLDAEDEPDDWQMEAEPGVDDPGFVGAGHWTDAPMQIYQFNVGTGGSDAPPLG